MKKTLALLLALVLLFSAVPFASAAHLTDCTAPADENGDGICDTCRSTISDESCSHAATNTTYPANNDGTHQMKITCGSCNVVLAETTVNCADSDANGTCDACSAAMALEEAVSITCPQNGMGTTLLSYDMNFILNGVDTDDVAWTYGVSGSAGATITAAEENGRTASVTVSAEGVGLAAVSVTAAWDGGEATGTFYMVFSSRKDWVVYLKDGITTLGFSDTGAFSKVSGLEDVDLKYYSLYNFLTDGTATRAILTEERKNNENIGKLTHSGTGKMHQYETDDQNDYAIKDLDSLTFTVLGEGIYKLNYELYEVTDVGPITTTKGTLSIAIGDPAPADKGITYRTAGKAVTFVQNDLVDYWEDNCRDALETLSYVKFDLTDLRGKLYTDASCRKEVKSAYKFGPETSATIYSMDTLTYVPDSSAGEYTEKIDFVASGKRDGVVRGTVTIIVTEDVGFSDVRKSDWFYGAVSYVCANGIMKGISDTKFEPHGTLTRAMVVTMLHRLEEEPAAETEGTFSDVQSGQWYTKAVEWAAKQGIVDGVGGGKFAPNDPITREQLATILYRYAKYDGKDVSVGEDTNILSFDDASAVNTYAVSAMQWACGEGIITGDNGKLMPGSTATRAQAAAMFQRFMQ